MKIKFTAKITIAVLAIMIMASCTQQKAEEKNQLKIQTNVQTNTEINSKTQSQTEKSSKSTEIVVKQEEKAKEEIKATEEIEKAIEVVEVKEVVAQKEVEIKEEINLDKPEFIEKTEQEIQSEDSLNSVTISITCVDKKIIQNQEVTIEENETVFDVLKKITRDNKIPMDFSGTASTAYVKGIDNFYEFDMGAESGWMYKVNGIFPNVSCGAYKLNKGDVIDWLYTQELGKDLGHSFE